MGIVTVVYVQDESYDQTQKTHCNMVKYELSFFELEKVSHMEILRAEGEAARRIAWLVLL